MSDDVGDCLAGLAKGRRVTVGRSHRLIRSAVNGLDERSVPSDHTTASLRS